MEYRDEQYPYDKQFTLLGPAIDADSSHKPTESLWRLPMEVFRSQRSQPESTPVVQENYAIRLMLQSASTQRLSPMLEWAAGGKRTVDFRRPVLLTALIRKRSKETNRPSLTSITFKLGEAKQAVYKVAQALDSADYADIVGQPVGKWVAGTQDQQAVDPATGTDRFEIQPLRLVNGCVPLQLKPGKRPGPLGLRDAGTHWTMFETFRCMKPSSGGAGPEVALVPAGIEFEATAPEPLRLMANWPGEVTVRLQASVVWADDKKKVVVALVGGPPAFLDALELGIKRKLYQLRSDTVVHLDFDTRPRVPLLFWRAEPDNKIYVVNTDSFHLDPSCLRLRLVTEAPLDGGGPSVAQAPLGDAIFKFENGAFSLAISATTAKADRTPALHFTAGTGDQAEKLVAKVTASLDIGIDRDSIAASLTGRYSEQGVMPPRAAVAPYAFIPLKNGWVQIPLGDCEGTFALPAALDAAPESVLIGTITLPLSGHATGRVEIDGASWFKIEATWGGTTGDAATATIEIADPAGFARSILFIADGSPRPEECLPSMDAGPVATREVPVRFGLRAYQERCGVWNGPEITLKWTPRKRSSGTNADATCGVVWKGHDRLPLISAIPMTRTIASGEPLRSRGLLPHVWRIEAGLPVKLDPAGRLPDLSAAFSPGAPNSLWQWPWPDLKSTQHLPAVSLTLPTLPGVELAPTSAQNLFIGGKGLHALLRHDLPVLDEYFASVPVPKSEIPEDAAKTKPVTVLPPTTLDPLRLIPYWQMQADKLSLSRAQRVDLFSWQEFPDRTERAATVSVAGLFEPGTWSTKFLFAPMNADLPVGRYELGNFKHAGSSALKGISGRFSEGGVADAGGPVEITGHAARVLLKQDLARDASGLSSAIELTPRVPLVAGLTLHLRESRFKADAGSDPAERHLGTLTAPVDVSLDGVPLRFWCRDLLLRKSGLVYEFKAEDSPPEWQIGSDSAAFDRTASQSGLHEWRFFQQNTGRYEIELGPFALKPLRLWGARFTRAEDGQATLESVAIIGSMSLARTLSAPVGGEPFHTEDAYESGNLVLLTLPRDGSGSFPSLKRVQVLRVGGAPKIIIAANNPALEFSINVKVDEQYLADDSKSAKQSVMLRLVLSTKAPDDRNPLRFSAASLQATLLGALCAVQAAFEPALKIRNTERKFGVTFESNPAPSVVRVTKLQFDYQPDADSTLVSTMELDIRAAQASALPVIRWSSESGTLKWLGLRAKGNAHIDHARGTIRCHARELAAPEQTRSNQIFGGLVIDDSTLSMQLLLALKLGKAPTADDTSVPAWPVVVASAGYGELRADCARIGTMRHMLKSGPQDNTGLVAWASTLSLDILMRDVASCIEWPVNAIAFPDDPSESVQPTGKGKKMEARSSPHVLRHSVSLDAHALPITLTVLRASGDLYELVSPLYAKVRATHKVMGKFIAKNGSERSLAFEWATLEHVEIRDFRDMVRNAAQESAVTHKDHEFAFAPRYRKNTYRGEQGKNWLIHPGIASRAYAAAGIPDVATAHLLDEWFTSFLSAQGLDRRKLKPDELEKHLPPSCLVIGGGSVTLCEWSAAAPHARPAALRWTLPWLVAAGDAANFLSSPVGAFQTIPTTSAPPELYQIADFDIIAARPAALEFARPYAFDATGTQTTIGSNLQALRRALIGKPKDVRREVLAEVTAVDTALVERLSAEHKPVPFDATSLRRAPLFLRTLLALRTLAEHSDEAAAPASSAFSTLVPVGTDDDGNASVVIRLSLSPAMQARAGKPAPVQSLIVLGREGLVIDTLPEDTIVGQESGVARIRGAAIAKVREPIMILYAERAQLAETDGVAWHDGAFTPVSPSAQAASFSRLRRAISALSDTLYASPALGWPDEADLRHEDGAFANLIEATLEPALDGASVLDAPFQNDDEGLALRAATFVGPTSATPALPIESDVRDRRAILWNHRQVVFDRANTSGSVAPPARLRVPTTQQTYSTLERLTGGGEIAARFQSMLPGAFERAVIGARPGVFYVEVDGTLLSTGQRPLDADQARFGQPATATPLLMRQQRYPRSPELPRVDAAGLTRRTFVSWNETFADTDEERKSWIPMCAVRGPATLLRVAGTSCSVLLRACQGPSLLEPNKAATPVLAYTESTLGEVLLHLTIGGIKQVGQDALRNFLAGAGLLRSGVTRAWLASGERSLRFTKAEHWPATDGKSYFIKFVAPVDEPMEAVFAIRALIQRASGDTPLMLRIALATERYPYTDAVPADQIDLALDKSLPKELPVQPAPVLSITLPVDPGSRAVIRPDVPVLCAFGDPSYDRALWSRVQRDSVKIQEETWLLAADRPEYNVDSTVCFAVGKVNADGNWVEPPNENAIEVALSVVRKLEDGTSKTYPVALTTAEKYERKLGFAHKALESRPHAIPLAELHAIREEGDPPKWVEPPVLAKDRFVLLPGDRVTIMAWVGAEEKSVTVDLAIVTNPVVSSPPAVYGVVCGKASRPKGFDTLSTVLYASAPMPQAIEMPDLRADLARGIVTRRGLFLWKFLSSAGETHAALIKIDRSGGGQLLDAFEDFIPLS